MTDQQFHKYVSAQWQHFKQDNPTVARSKLVVLHSLGEIYMFAIQNQPLLQQSFRNIGSEVAKEINRSRLQFSQIPMLRLARKPTPV